VKRSSAFIPHFLFYLPSLLLLALLGCGGGSSGNTAQAPPSSEGDFDLAISPPSQTLTPGSSNSILLSATAINGFSSAIAVQVSGLPEGVSVSPANISVEPGTPQSVKFTASQSTASANATVTFTATAGDLNHTAQLLLEIGNFSSSAPGRTRYVRTDATTEYYLSVNSHWVVFNPPTGRFFVTDPRSSHVFVFDSASETEVAVIPVPGAFAIGDSSDHKTLYVGTMIGDVYTIDPVAMAVTHRYLASQIGPYGFEASIALGLSNGDIALLGGAGNAVDGSSSFAVWNVAQNSITIYASQYTASIQPRGVPYTVVCGSSMGSLGGFALTADRDSILVGSVDSDATLCEVNASTGKDIYNTAKPFLLNNLLVTPDGKYVVLPDYGSGNAGQADLYDAKTLNKLSAFSVSGDTSTASGFAVSADSKTLFVPSAVDNIIYAYSLDTQKQIGWLPNLYINPTSGGSAVGPVASPYLLAVDGTGLFAGPLEEGIGFVDSAAMQTGPVGTKFTNGLLNNPVSGPASGGTQISWTDPYNVDALAGIFLGAHPASTFSNSEGSISATTPAGSPGPADVYAFTADGGMQVIPESFSYGPTILEVTPDRSTQEGGGTGAIFGYGFGPVNSTAIPSGLKVTVGGNAAKVTGYSSDVYGIAPPPFPLQSLAYVVPAGNSGSSVNVVVSTPAGQATAHSALSYLPAAQQFPLAGAVLAEGIYDPYTDVYYFTDANKLQVFSRTQGSWLTPINIPGPPGAAQRLWGISLSPDGTQLAIADASAQVIYLLNPSNPGSVQTFSVPTLPNYTGVITNAIGLAVTDSGTVYYAATVVGGSGYYQFFELDTSTDTVTPLGPMGNGAAYLRAALGSNQGVVYFNSNGAVFSVNVGTNNVTYAAVDPGGGLGNEELTLSNDQSRLSATGYLYDSDLAAESFYALNDRESANIAYVYGAKLNADGTLLFQPSTNGIDVLDGRLGNLLTRIALPVTLSSNYDALVSDGKDNVLLAITGENGNGVAVVDLSSIPEPPPLGYDKINSFEGRFAETSASQSQIREAAGLKSQPLGDRRAPARVVPHVTRQFSRSLK
jgi:WD40 repeat protein